MNYESLANTEKFPAGKWREINREMIVWTAELPNYPHKSWVSVWDGFKFHIQYTAMHKPMRTTIEHACEVPKSSENEFVRADKTLEERVEALERTQSDIMQKCKEKRGSK